MFRERVNNRREMEQAGMLVELSKQETVSTMDTVEKSYGCYSIVQEFRNLGVIA